MNMAYLLNESQGLKTLAYRKLGIRMKSYSDMVAGVAHNKAVAYLTEAVKHEYPDLDPVSEWSPTKNDWHVRQPQNVLKKMKRILKDVESKGADPYDRFQKLEGRELVEERLGIMHPGYLKDLPRDEAINYSAQDADVTLQLYYKLLEEGDHGTI
jgi:hypothetical protein